MQALILAAGMGKRLHKDMNKCMVEVNGISLWNRMLRALKIAHVSRVVVVTGYHADELEMYMKSHAQGMELCFVRNKDYEITNNIWSFYLAHPYLDEDTILLESDLIFEEELIPELCNSQMENAAVLAKYEEWMDGTTVQMDKGYVSKVIPKKEMQKYDLESLYKTVNIYKFSKEFLEKEYLPALEKFIRDYGKNEYYEMVLKEMVAKESAMLGGYELKGKWYEIDTVDDLETAEKIFA